MEENTNIESTIDEQTESDFTSNCMASTVNGHTVQHKKDLDKKNILSSCWHKFRTVLSNLIKQVASTYSKRNPIVNAMLSLVLLTTIIVSCIIFLSSFAIFYAGKGAWSLGMTGAFYLFFCVYYMCKFIIANRKDAIISAFMGATFVWLAVINFYIILTTPDYEFSDEEGNGDMAIFIFTLILSLLFNTIAFGILYLIMKIKKYGASAWTLLDIPRGKKSKFDKILFSCSFVIWILPIGVFTYLDYKSKHSFDKYPSLSNAKIGDYYYEDGTVSSELLSDKKVVGMVFSLETSEKDKIMGYNHGQIVSLTDISSSKMQWDNNTKDYEKYPNYIWKNRLDALNDIDGLEYTNREEFTCPTINRISMKYMEGEIKGISSWYVPTAGQWARILENLGNVRVNNMLKFDAEIASKNLKGININPQKWYWTITEFDAENAWSIRPVNGEFGSRSNKHNEANVRPVASF